MQTVDKIVKYIDEGISHFNSEKENLGTTSERSAKFMYIKGAVDSLENMKSFIRMNFENKETDNTSNDSKEVLVDFEGVIPLNIDYGQDVYRKLLESKCDILYYDEKSSNQFVKVGECNSGVNMNLIFIKGKLKKELIRDGKSAIDLIVVSGNPKYILSVGNKDSNIKEIKDNKKHKLLV